MRLEFFQKKMFKHLDWLLLGIIFAIVIFGVVAITSLTSPGYDPETMSFGDFIEGLNFKESVPQLMFFGMGIVAIFVVLLLDYNNLRDFSNILYWISVALLLAVLIFSTEIRGISGWFMIGGFGFQPAEYCKIIMILVLAKEFAQRTEGKEEGITTFRELWPILWRFAIPFVLIMKQPDWGTAMVYIFMLGGVMFMSKTSLKLIGGLVLSGVVMAPVLWQLYGPVPKKQVYKLSQSGAVYR